MISIRRTDLSFDLYRTFVRTDIIFRRERREHMERIEPCHLVSFFESNTCPVHVGMQSFFCFAHSTIIFETKPFVVVVDQQLNFSCIQSLLCSIFGLHSVTFSRVQHVPSVLYCTEWTVSNDSDLHVNGSESF